MKKFLKFILFLIIVTVCGFILCIALFHTTLFKSINVLMYRGLALIILTGIILAIILSVIYYYFKKKRIELFEPKDILSAIIVFMCIKLSFFVLVPVTVDRSVSVFTLTQIENKDDDTITKEEATKIFLDKYVYENDAFGKRFDEQIVTGSIKENTDGSFTLTPRGHFLVDFFKTIGKLYSVDMTNMH